jgi:sugar lactone lactonase YvrE
VVTQVAADGRKAEFADGFTQPIGLAFGPGATLFVADFAANRIMRLDAKGAATVFATIQAPVHLAVEPHVPTEGEP